MNTMVSGSCLRGPSMTESTKIDYVSIVQDLRDEADLCRNETATDIADLLDDAASCIVAMKSQFTALRSDLAAAQEALKNHLHLDNHNAIVRQLEERAQRAEDLAESYRDALNRFKEEREGNTRQFRRLQERLAQAEADAFSMSAGQCIVTNGGLMGDYHGHLYCDMQRQRDEMRGKIRVMADIMNTALDVMKTVEGDGSDEDEDLMHIRAKMASAIASVIRADKSAIDAAIAEGKK